MILPSEYVSLSGLFFARLIDLVVVVEALGVWKSVLSISIVPTPILAPRVQAAASSCSFLQRLSYSIGLE